MNKPFAWSFGCDKCGKVWMTKKRDCKICPRCGSNKIAAEPVDIREEIRSVVKCIRAY